jgi:basic amino acid/polyamine antiporter, APA family
MSKGVRAGKGSEAGDGCNDVHEDRGRGSSVELPYPSGGSPSLPDASPDASASLAPSKPALIRAVGLLGLTAIAVNGVIGAGIFVLPATVAALLGPASPMAYIIAAVVIALIVLCFAEAGSMFDRTGGPYLYAREAFGGFVGFEVGVMFFLSRLAAAAAVSNAFAAYLGIISPALAVGPGRIASITVLLFGLAWLNLVGVRYGAWTVNLLTIMKLVPLILLVSIGLFSVDSNSYRLLILPGTGQFPDINSLRQASLALVFAFGGFENASVPSEEVKNPTTSLPVALIVSIVLTAALYILIQVVALGTVPNLAGDSTPLASAGRVVLGSAGALVITVGAILSTSGSNSALVLVGPRILYAFSQAGQLPAILGRVHPRYRTPHVAVIIFAVMAWAAALYGNFAQLVTVSAIARLLFSATTCLAIPMLRHKLPHARREFRVPGGLLIPSLAALTSTWLLIGINKTQAVAGVSAMIAGAGLYLFFGRDKRDLRPVDDI